MFHRRQLGRGVASVGLSILRAVQCMHELSLHVSIMGQGLFILVLDQEGNDMGNRTNTPRGPATSSQGSWDSNPALCALSSAPLTCSGPGVNLEQVSGVLEGGGASQHTDRHGRLLLSPQMNMLMRLQEAANYSSPQSYDSDSNSNSHHDDILDSSLESTL